MISGSSLSSLLSKVHRRKRIGKANHQKQKIYYFRIIPSVDNLISIAERETLK